MRQKFKRDETQGSADRLNAAQPGSTVTGHGERRIARGAATLGAVAGLLALGAHAAERVTTAAWQAARPMVAANPYKAVPVTLGGLSRPVVGQKVLADEFTDRISSASYWRDRRPSAPSSAPPAVDRSKLNRGRANYLLPPQPQPQPGFGWFAAPSGSPWIVDDSDGRLPPAQRSESKRGAGFGSRVVCVRLCDGFFFPIGGGGSADGRSRASAECSRACPGAKLYVQKSSSEELDDFVDLNGQAYTKLRNANLFRTTYVESCKCKPHAWEKEASDLHRLYALETQRKKGNRAVAAELEMLKVKTRQETALAARRRAAADAPILGPSTAPRSDVGRGQTVAAVPATVNSTGTEVPGSSAAAASVSPAAGNAASNNSTNFSRVLASASGAAGGGVARAAVAATIGKAQAIQQSPSIAGGPSASLAGSAASVEAVSAPEVSAEATSSATRQRQAKSSRSKSRSQNAPGQGENRQNQAARSSKTASADWVARSFNTR